MPGQTEKAFDFLDGKRGLSPFSPRFPTGGTGTRGETHVPLPPNTEPPAR
jgi:hypothetical protein